MSRAELRISENRGKPIDALAINMSLSRKSLDLYIPEPVLIFSKLHSESLAELSAEIDFFVDIVVDKEAQGFWKARACVCRSYFRTVAHAFPFSSVQRQSVMSYRNNRASGKKMKERASIRASSLMSRPF